MKRFILLAALAGGLSVVTGCQMSGDRHVDTTNRPADYTYAYNATRDTEWRASTDSNAASGTISRGTTVYFDRAAGSSQWQQARVSDGSIRYVHPSDFGTR